MTSRSCRLREGNHGDRHGAGRYRITIRRLDGQYDTFYVWCLSREDAWACGEDLCARHEEYAQTHCVASRRS